MVPPIRIAVLASGRGSGFESIYQAICRQQLNAEIVAVISDRPEAPVLEKARAVGISAFGLPSLRSSGAEVTQAAQAAQVERRKLHEKQILAALEPFQPKFLVFAGYMRILTPYIIEAFRCDRGYSRMVNIHPSLLPAFPGVRSYQQAFDYGTKWTGVTVHLVEPTVDAGPICAQEAFSIADCASAEEVEKRGLEIEHRLYPETLRWVLAEEFTLKARPDIRTGLNRERRYYVCQN